MSDEGRVEDVEEHNVSVETARLRRNARRREDRQRREREDPEGAQAARMRHNEQVRQRRRQQREEARRRPLGLRGFDADVEGVSFLFRCWKNSFVSFYQSHICQSTTWVSWTAFVVHAGHATMMPK